MHTLVYSWMTLGHSLKGEPPTGERERERARAPLVKISTGKNETPRRNSAHEGPPKSGGPPKKVRQGHSLGGTTRLTLTFGSEQKNLIIRGSNRRKSRQRAIDNRDRRRFEPRWWRDFLFKPFKGDPKWTGKCWWDSVFVCVRRAVLLAQYFYRKFYAPLPQEEGSISECVVTVHGNRCKSYMESDVKQAKAWAEPSSMLPRNGEESTAVEVKCFVCLCKCAWIFTQVIREQRVNVIVWLAPDGSNPGRKGLCCVSSSVKSTVSKKKLWEEEKRIQQSSISVRIINI